MHCRHGGNLCSSQSELAKTVRPTGVSFPEKISAGHLPRTIFFFLILQQSISEEKEHVRDQVKITIVIDKSKEYFS